MGRLQGDNNSTFNQTKTRHPAAKSNFEYPPDLVCLDTGVAFGCQHRRLRFETVAGPMALQSRGRSNIDRLLPGLSARKLLKEVWLYVIMGVERQVVVGYFKDGLRDFRG